MQLRTIVTRAEMTELAHELREERERIGFVPTMGFLHQGHLSLMEIAKRTSSKTVASIFVNPTQFNASSDLDEYPRDLDRDLELLEKHGVDFAFVPSVEEIYPKGFSASVSVTGVADKFEGAGRPGHFEGVVTVLSILFNVVMPHFAVFGEKDFQQLRVVEKLVKNLSLPLEIVRGPLVREHDGIALSSRNVRLSNEGRRGATLISQALFAARDLFLAGNRKREDLLRTARDVLAQHSDIEIEYLELVREEDFAQIREVGVEPARLITTAHLEGVRLLDNMPLVDPLH